MKQKIVTLGLICESINDGFPPCKREIKFWKTFFLVTLSFL